MIPFRQAVPYLGLSQASIKLGEAECEFFIKKDLIYGKREIRERGANLGRS
jgi:hypothetical protein